MPLNFGSLNHLSGENTGKFWQKPLLPHNDKSRSKSGVNLFWEILTHQQSVPHILWTNGQPSKRRKLVKSALPKPSIKFFQFYISPARRLTNNIKPIYELPFVQRGKEKNYFIFQTTEFLHALHPSFFFLSLRGGDGGMERESWIRVRTCKSRQKKLEETCDHQELAVTCALWRHSWRVAMTPPPSFANTPVWAPFTLKMLANVFWRKYFFYSLFYTHMVTHQAYIHLFWRFVNFLAKKVLKHWSRSVVTETSGSYVQIYRLQFVFFLLWMWVKWAR